MRVYLFLLCFYSLALVHGQYQGGEGRGAATQSTEQTTLAGSSPSMMYRGGTGTGDGQGTSEVNAATLPLTFLAFRARAEAAEVQLYWRTEREESVDYFTVERSGDGQAFESIGTVAARGGVMDTAAYFFTDPRPVGGTSYYRLHARDFDGSTNYSSIRTVNIAAAEWSFELYPNPARATGCTLLLTGPLPQDAITLTVTNLTGQRVLTRDLQQGTHGRKQLISPTVLATGTYIVALERTDGPAITKKLVVID